jgi:hypothetical protein
MSMDGVARDVVEVQRHRDEHQPGQRRGTAADDYKVVVPQGGLVHTFGTSS